MQDTLPTGTGAASFALTSFSLLGLVNIEPKPICVLTVSSADVVDAPPTEVTGEFFGFFLLYVLLVAFYRVT